MKLSFVTTAAVAILATGASADVQYWCGVLADKCSKDTPAGTLGLPATAECGEKVFRKKGKWVGEKKMWVITGTKKLDKNWPKFKKCCHDDKMYDGRPDEKAGCYDKFGYDMADIKKVYKAANPTKWWPW
jgi:hypothetical protein